MNEEPFEKLNETLMKYKKAIDSQNALIRQMKEDFKSGKLQNLDLMLEELKKKMSVFEKLATEE